MLLNVVILEFLGLLIRAYIGFCENPFDSNLPSAPVATGNWGCGAFGGNLHLKALIQIMACTTANRNIVYFTFGDKKLQYAVFNVYNFLCSNNVTVAQLWRYLCKFSEAGISKHQLLPFIKQIHIDNANNTLEENPNDMNMSKNVRRTAASRSNIFNKSVNKQRTPSPSVGSPRKNPRKTNNDVENCPSTSKEQKTVQSSKAIEINSQSEDDIIDASQEDILPIPKCRSKGVKPSPKNSKITPSPNKFKRMRDVSALFYSSDEEDIEAEKCAGFLSHLDNLANTSKINNDSKMDVDALISSDDSECLMEVVVDKRVSETKEAIKSDKRITNDTSSSSQSQKDTSKSRKSLITDYFKK